MIISVIIPTKNEQDNIGNLLSVLLRYLPDNSEVIISDAESTDKTLDIVNSFSDNRIKIIKGGLPSKGRNNGSKISKSNYLLFIDADMIPTKELIYETLRHIELSDYKLIGCKLRTKTSFKAKILYKLCNISFILSKYDKPFVIGGYFLINKDEFNRLGGFDENNLHCEDYCLSSQVNRRDFHIISEYVYTGDRRISKMGFWGMLVYFITNITKRNKKNYFNKDVGYWK